MQNGIQALLRRENYQLRSQLKEAQSVIDSLRHQNQRLLSKLSKYEGDSLQDDDLMQTPKMSRMHVQEHFEGSSEEQEVENSISSNYRSPNVKIQYSPLSHSSNISNRYNYNSGRREQDTSKTQIEVNRSSSKKVIINEDSHIYRRKEINKVLKKSSERNKDNDFMKNSQSPYKPMTAREIPAPSHSTSSIMMNRQISSVKSEKLISFKNQPEPNSKPIFQHFFVTGMTKQGPCVTYSYPHGSGHKFDGYLSLMYGENSLKHPDLSTSSSKSKIVQNPLKENPFSIYIKDTFVIPIIKPEAKDSEKDYLIVCEVEELVIQKEFVGCYFPRYYCFLSQWKFFMEFRRLTSQLIDRIHIRKKNYQELNEMVFTKIIQEEVQQGINFLFQKSIDYNKTLDCCIGASGLKFTAQVPSVELSYQMIEKYQQWEIINSIVQFRLNETSSPIQTQLFGVLVTYALAEMKIVLFSSVKSKISEAIMQLLEIIRPLSYVNPILMATLKDEHQNYLDAPMSIILGLWVEQKKPSRQKIEIYMNKKMNLTGLIQKAVLSVSDGIIINLDTGLIFGGGVKTQLIQLSHRLNCYRKRFSRSRQTYKMIQKMLLGKLESQECRQLWQSLYKQISGTQAYCYYKQRRK